MFKENVWTYSSHPSLQYHFKIYPSYLQKMYSIIERKPSKSILPCYSALLRQRKEMEHEHLAIKKYMAIPLLNPSCYATRKKKITCAAKQLRSLQLFEMVSYSLYSANNSLYNKDYTFSPSITLTAFSRVIYASFFPGE